MPPHQFTNHMKATFVLASIIFFSFLSSAATPQTPPQPWDQWAEAYPSWVEPVEPFRIIDNIHYVGTKGLGSFLMTTDEGHILLDGGLPQNAKLISNSIEQLGFNLSDVKILLNSHAHFDHSGGLAELKERSGALLFASENDREALETGFYAGSINPNYSAPPVVVDKVIKDGELVELGGLKLKPILMPGHSPGCTFWSMNATESGKQYSVLFFGSATVAGNRLVGPPQYPGIVEDYRSTFSRARTQQPDVLLANHPEFSGLWDKRKRQIESGSSTAFVDTEIFPELMEKLETDFEMSLVIQTEKLQEDLK